MPSIFLGNPVTATAQWWTVSYYTSQGVTGRLAGGDSVTSVSVQAGSSSAALADVQNQVGASGYGFSVKGPFATEPGGPSLTGTPGTPGTPSPVYGAACYFVIPEGSAGQVVAALAPLKGLNPVVDIVPIAKVVADLAKLGSTNNVMTASGPIQDQAQQAAMKQQYGQCYPSAAAATKAADADNTSGGSPQFGLSIGNTTGLLTRFLKILIGGVLIIAGILKLTGTEDKLRVALPRVAGAAAGIGLI